MERTSLEGRNGQKGFTLVELAIVMIIIGLLIGGILKGQELINNATVASTVAEIKGIDAGINTFRDQYASLPGDIANPQVRLPTCTVAPCSTAGDGSGRINQTPDAAVNNAANENFTFWTHLSAADILSAVDGTTNLVVGQGLPSSNIGGTYNVGYYTGAAALPGSTGAAAAPAGHYLSLRPGNAATGAGTVHIDTAQAARIDRKMDEGSPNSGSVRAVGSAAGGGVDCATANTTAGLYNEDNRGLNCALYIRVQS